MPADLTEISVNTNTGVDNFNPTTYPEDGKCLQPSSSVTFKAARGPHITFYAYTGTGPGAIAAFSDNWQSYTAPTSTGHSASYKLLSTIKNEPVTLSLTDPHGDGPIVGTNGTINVGGGGPE